MEKNLGPLLRKPVMFAHRVQAASGATFEEGGIEHLLLFTSKKVLAVQIVVYYCAVLTMPVAGLKFYMWTKTNGEGA